MHCAVVGDPIAHSLSPALHRAGYRAVGLTATYDAHRVTEGKLAGFVAGLSGSWRGLSVTAPLKREALALADVVSPRASLAGGANTLLLVEGEQGRSIHADNTDLPGAVAAIRERYDGPVGVGTIVGAGATAASTGLALVELGARHIRLLARDGQRAAGAAAAIAGHPSGPSVEVLGLDAEVIGEVVVSTVPAAAQDPGLVARCAKVSVVFDVLYDPWPTPLAGSAIHNEQRLVSGLDLLVHQAALQFVAFTGHPAPLEAMRTAGVASLRERSR